MVDGLATAPGTSAPRVVAEACARAQGHVRHRQNSERARTAVEMPWRLGLATLRGAQVVLTVSGACAVV